MNEVTDGTGRNLDMDRCSTQIEDLREELDADIWTFRIIWLVNVAAVVWGIVAHNYPLVGVSAVCALVGLVGVGRTRRGKKMFDRFVNVCLGRGRTREDAAAQ